MAKRDSESGREGLGQMPWLPGSTEEQLKLGIELINYAFLTRGTAMQREESALAARVQELANKLREAEDRTADCELEIQDLRTKYAQATEENRVMAGTIRKLKIENARLEDIKNNIKSTIDMSVSSHAPDPLGSPHTREPLGPSHEYSAARPVDGLISSSVRSTCPCNSMPNTTSPTPALYPVASCLMSFSQRAYRVPVHSR